MIANRYHTTQNDGSKSEFEKAHDIASLMAEQARLNRRGTVWGVGFMLCLIGVFIAFGANAPRWAQAALLVAFFACPLAACLNWSASDNAKRRRLNQHRWNFESSQTKPKDRHLP